MASQDDTIPRDDGDNSSPSIAVRDRSVLAMDCTRRMATRLPDAGASAGTRTMMAGASATMANPGSSSPPPNCSQDTTALPSLPSLLSPEDMAGTNAMPATHGDVDDDGFHLVRGSRERCQMLSMGHAS